MAGKGQSALASQMGRVIETQRTKEVETETTEQLKLLKEGNFWNMSLIVGSSCLFTSSHVTVFLRMEF